MKMFGVSFWLAIFIGFNVHALLYAVIHSSPTWIDAVVLFIVLFQVCMYVLVYKVERNIVIIRLKLEALDQVPKELNTRWLYD